MESQEKPLHVKVAEALGCKTCFIPEEENRPEDNYFVNTGWRCGCTERKHGLANVVRYDTDWSATGPLIEKFRITVRPYKFVQENAHDGWVAVVLDRSTIDEALSEWGATPLLAVCNLIVNTTKGKHE